MFNLGVFTGFDFRDSHLHSNLKNKKTQRLQIKELAKVCTNPKTFLLLSSLCIVEIQNARKDSVNFSIP